jgi:aromatic ring-opening dioxygenase catalytic subunit (LigB family)
MNGTTTRLPTFYLSHGGGPWPYMNGSLRQHYGKLETSLETLPRQLGAEPTAILVVSGHWEERDFAVMASPAPPMVYDFGGFPEYLYHVRYPAAGSPQLAERIESLIQDAGLPTHLDPVRGFDHGTYSLLAVTHPEADIPVLQVSIRSDYDPELHLALGRALSPLRDEGVLIIGSGSSYHNLSALVPERIGFYPNKFREESAQFDSWLRKTLTEFSSRQRLERLLDWERAPSARAVHPQEDHLVPLHVAVGAAEDEPAHVIYAQDDLFGKITMSSYRFGN